jgi:GNAT superfamily N-acetyltransferase
MSWAFRSCVSRDVADEVLVADLAGSIVGFATLRLNGAEEGEGVLFGVAPRAQRKGIYRSLVINSMQWCLAKGMRHMIYSTQINNIAVQKVLVRLGFEPSYAYYTFHKWFD